MSGWRVPILLKMAGIWVAVYLGLAYGIQPLLPSSLLWMFMALVTIGILLYVTIYTETMEEFFQPIVTFFAGSGGRPLVRYGRWAVLALLPLLVGFQTYRRALPSLAPPAAQRVIHPAPPIEFAGLSNPLREDQERFDEYVAEGARVYYQNCFYCHGDRLDGKGHFAHAFNLPPANFQDPGTIAQLQESFVFWRVSTGGPGLPAESTPWDSAMPRWETMLTEEERWKTILFLYDYTGWTPRTWE